METSPLPSAMFTTLPENSFFVVNLKKPWFGPSAFSQARSEISFGPHCVDNVKDGPSPFLDDSKETAW